MGLIQAKYCSLGFGVSSKDSKSAPAEPDGRRSGAITARVEGGAGCDGTSACRKIAHCAETLVKCRVSYPLRSTATEALMSAVDLRPLSIGEILDRTFSLYRRNFQLFIGISAIPHLLVLAFQLAQLAFMSPSVPVRPSATADFQSNFPGFSTGGVLGALALGLVGFIIYIVAYLFSQGGTVFAVSELYLGRATTIGQSLGRVRGELGSLFGVVFLNGLVTIVSFMLLIIPGIYMVCRLCVCIPAALLENLGPRESLERSFGLTKDNVGRAFLILLLYFVILYAAIFLFDIPFAIGIQFEAHNPGTVRTLTALMQVGNFVSTVLITPVLTIASAIFYFDLRVRKEAFDLQLMMNPLAGGMPAPPSATSLLS
jgi:hypothetical protein